MEEERHGYGPFAEKFCAVSDDAYHQFGGDVLHVTGTEKPGTNDPTIAG